VLPLPPVYDIDDIETGLSLVQLKRALRDAAFARGALFLLRSDQLLEDAEVRKHIDTLDDISSQIVDLVRMLREAHC
jgi:hypothetical protein